MGLCCLYVTTCVSFGVAILGIILGWGVFPGVVENAILENLIIEEGTAQYDRWVDTPIALDFKVYLFNVENPTEVINGAKPILREVGPYIYKEYMWKTNVTQADNKLKYLQYRRFVYDQEASGDLKETDKIFTLNLVLNAIIQIAEVDGFGGTALLNLINTFLPGIFGQNRDIVMEVTVKDLLFDGIKFCENYTLPVCGTIARFASISPAITEENRTLYFSLFAQKQEKHDGFYTIRNGRDDYYQIGQIIEWDNQTALSSWPGGPNASCNQIHGTDTTMFAPFLNRTAVLDIFAGELCRSADIRYVEDTEYFGIKLYRYSLLEDFLEEQSEENDNLCYCANVTKGISQDNGCLKKGTMELFPCLGAHVVLTLPHMLWTDPAYLETVEGMSPEREKHVTIADIDPYTGVPLRGVKRIQFNMFTRPIRGIRPTQNLGVTRLFPILWVEEGVDVPEDLVMELKQLYDILEILEIVKWCLIGIGLFFGFGLFFTILYKRNKAKNVV